MKVIFSFFPPFHLFFIKVVYKVYLIYCQENDINRIPHFIYEIIFIMI